MADQELDRLLEELKKKDVDEPTILKACQLINAKYSRDVDVAAKLAWILAKSGEILSFNETVVADIASTGGPTSLSTLLPQFFLRAAGAKVPKLGGPGWPVGAIDSLAQIPGYRTTLSADEIKDIVEGPAGHAHFVAGADMAPLDGRMYQIRKANGLFKVDTLTAASILSNKIAAGVTYTGLDIRVFKGGNFGEDDPAAYVNKQFYIEVAKRLGIKARPVLTSLSQPYQPYFGRRESLLALDYVFRGAGPRWLSDHVETCRSLAMACLPEHLRGKLANVPREELRRHFDQNLLAQGAHPVDFDALLVETRKAHDGIIEADHGGYCSYKVSDINDEILAWQKLFPKEKYADPVGLILLVEPGTAIKSGTPIASFRAPDALKKDVELKLGQILNKFGEPTTKLVTERATELA